MNILFLESDMSRQGGTKRMTAVLSGILSKTDLVWIISTQFKGNKLFFDLDPDVRHVILGTIEGNHGIIRTIRCIRKFIKQNKIDHVINVDIGMSIFGIPAVWGTKTKVITWEHSNYFNNWNSRWIPLFRRFAARHSDSVVVLTEKDKINYETHIKCHKPIYVIPNSVQRHVFHYSMDSKTILSAGMLHPVKGFDSAVRAAALVLPKYPDWKWIISGEGPERERLEDLIHHYDLEKQVLLPGTITDIDEFYKKAAFFVMTSEMEGLPLVLLEAKSWGLPIISFDIMTGPSEIINDNVNGFLVPPNDVHSLAEKIELLISDKEIRKELSDNSQIGLNKFDINEINRKWKGILN